MVPHCRKWHNNHEQENYKPLKEMEIFSYFQILWDLECDSWAFYDFETGDYYIIHLWYFTVDYTPTLP